MSCYRTILVAVDGSRDATAALRHAATLARDQHATLVVLTVVPAGPPQAIIPAGAIAPPVDNERDYGQILRAAVDALPPDVGVQTRQAHGRPARQIVDVAEQTGCDLIVMGFHGHGRLHHALIGSVSDSVMRASTLPVLLMRAGAATAQRSEDPARRPARPRAGAA